LWPPAEHRVECGRRSTHKTNARNAHDGLVVTMGALPLLPPLAMIDPAGDVVADADELLVAPLRSFFEDFFSFMAARTTRTWRSSVHVCECAAIICCTTRAKVDEKMLQFAHSDCARVTICASLSLALATLESAVSYFRLPSDLCTYDTTHSLFV
jgi:hypothetical protein